MDTKFQKGNPGGPGRPKGAKNKLTSTLKNDMFEYEDLVKEAMRDGLEKKDFSFVKLWMEYTFGKPQQSIQQDIFYGNSDMTWLNDIEEMDEDELKEKALKVVHG